jgi:hypothetical protein
MGNCLAHVEVAENGMRFLDDQVALFVFARQGLAGLARLRPM